MRPAGSSLKVVVLIDVVCREDTLRLVDFLRVSS